MAEKCPHHDEFIERTKSLKDYIDLRDKHIDKSLESLESQMKAAFKKIDEHGNVVIEQGKAQERTETYVRALYDKFDSLVDQMKSIATKLDSYVTNMAIVTADTNKNSSFTKDGKKLVFEIIKWFVLMAIGAAIVS